MAGAYRVEIVISAAANVLFVLRGLLFMSPLFIGLALLERFGPVYGERPALIVQLRGGVFQIAGLSIGVVLATPIWRLAPHVPPLWPALAFPLAFLVSDFLQYWEHRLEHRLFWRVHAVHHSSRQMCATLDVHHFGHVPLMALIYNLPMGLLTHDPLASTAVTILTQAWGAYIHSPTRLSIGPLRYVLADNRIHRIHHALDPSLHDRNFGAILTIWDVLFGTMVWPKKGQWPQTGVADYGEIEAVRDFVLRPLMPSRQGTSVQAGVVERRPIKQENV